MTTTTTTALPHRRLGLTDDELDRIKDLLGREPSYEELAMFSVMWSEHCSYKSSRVHLKRLPSDAPHVLVGPGEGAGIIEVAPGLAVAWKIESHNHPSFVEPVNGAATGVGGIVRDIVSMGARPIALLDSLRFGRLEDAHTRYLVNGVVDGISSYGNSIGVPTVGGELVFDDCYAENPLVNVACLGVVENGLMTGRAEGPGNSVVLFGSSTGRDGIGGASVLASAEFGEDSLTKRPSVQVGDPLAEKLLIEVSLELVRRGLLVGLQDLGAGGVSCPASEMAAKAGTGIALDTSEVHLRERPMEAFEILISESQERMLAIVAPGDIQAVLEVCERWGLAASVVGRVTGSSHIEVTHEGSIVADVPAPALAEDGPVYRRPLRRPDRLDELRAAACGDIVVEDLGEALLDLLGSPNCCSRRWVWEQYDHMIWLGTVGGPGGDAAVIRLPNSEVAVALSTDGNGRVCRLDPYDGARLAVAEAARNVACTGARPLAVTNCLNFGSPEKPEVMWQFAETVAGIADACNALATPVTGGNVSFYNETSGRAIHPTPVIGMLGAMPHADRAVGLGFRSEGDSLVLLGATDGRDFGGSEYSHRLHGVTGGRPPRLDLAAERRLHELLVEGAASGLLASAHDLSTGGLAIALAESAIAGGIGFSVSLPAGEAFRVLFSESPSRVLVSCDPSRLDALLALAARLDVPAELLGRTGGNALDFGVFSRPLAAAAEAFEAGLPQALSATLA